MVLGLLCSCNSKISDRVLKAKIDSECEPNNYKVIFLPIGDVTFNELEQRSYGFIGKQTILFDNFMALQDEGLISCVQKERVGRIYRLQIDLTDKGKEYLHGTKSKQGSLHFIPLKAYTLERGRILNIEYDTDISGTCTYTMKYKEVTPFGKIWLGAEKGKEHPNQGGFHFFKSSETGKWTTH